MRANVGDELIVGETAGGPARVGTILAVRGSDGAPPYLVHWVAGDYDALVSPGPGVRIRHRRPGPQPAETRAVSPCRAEALT